MGVCSLITRYRLGVFRCGFFSCVKKYGGTGGKENRAQKSVVLTAIIKNQNFEKNRFFRNL